MRKNLWTVVVLSALFALVAAACSQDSDDALTGRGIADGGVTSPDADTDTDADVDTGEDGTDGTGTDPATGDDAADGTTDDGTATDDGTDPAGDGANDPAPTPDGLVWTVIGVGWDDTLNVRAEPNASAQIVGELAPWTTEVSMTGDVSGTSSRWREVALADGTTGWVNARFVVGQPAALSLDEQSALVEQGTDFVGWVRTGGGDPESFVATRGLWAAGIGIYADAGSEWNWVAASELSDDDGWRVDRDWVVGQGIECGGECVLSTREFLDLDRIDGTTQVLLNDIPGANEAHLEGMLWEAPNSLHRVVIDTPTSDPDQFLDWQRLHMIPDWSDGQVAFKVIHNHGWTP